MENLRIQMLANNLYDEEDFEGAIQKLNEISDDKLTGQHYYNLSRYEYRLVNEERNLKALKNCVVKDPNMAIGYFQLAVTQFELNLVEEALENFKKCYDCMRGNPIIDYRPLNLSITLYESDVAYNIALCNLHLENIEEFKEHITIAMEQAEDIERHRLIRELERVKDEAVINETDFELVNVSPFTVYRVSPKVRRAFQSPSLLEQRAVSKVVGGDGNSGFCPVSTEENLRLSNLKTSVSNDVNGPLSAKLRSTLLKEQDRKHKDTSKENETSYEKGSTLGQLVPAVNSIACATVPVDLSQDKDTKAVASSPLLSSSSFHRSSSPLSPKRPSKDNLNSADNLKSSSTNLNKTVKSSKIASDQEPTETIKDSSTVTLGAKTPKLKKKSKKKKEKNVDKEVSKTSDKLDAAKLSKQPPVDHHKSLMSNLDSKHQETKLQKIKKTRSSNCLTSSLSDFSEGVGDQKLQGDQRKDEKRLEVKIPSDSDGLNSSVRLAVKVSLDLELEVSRCTDYETMMLHLRDRLHAIASITSPSSTTPRLYTKQGEPVLDEENYKELTKMTNSVDLVLK